MKLLLLYLDFNSCHFQLLKSCKRHKENKSKIGQERSSMQQADYQCHWSTSWMQESVSMHKSPAPVRHSRMNQARSEKKEKEKKRDSKERGQEAKGKKGSPTKYWMKGKKWRNYNTEHQHPVILNASKYWLMLHFQNKSDLIKNKLSMSLSLNKINNKN